MTSKAAQSGLGKVATAKDVIRAIKAKADPVKALSAAGYFKTGKGQYGEGDIFLGLTTPTHQKIAKEFTDLSHPEIAKLLESKIHEYRSVALTILVDQFTKASKAKNEKERTRIVRFYLAHRKGINNWDLVDGSARYIVGAYLFNHPKERTILYKLAKSKNLWDKRIAIISTHYFILQNEHADALAIMEILLKDKHDLIHKAVGWMLREVGKRDLKVEEKFLDKYAATMPRTSLRYAIERFSPARRAFYMKMKGK